MAAEVEVAETALVIKENLQEYLQGQVARIPGIAWDVHVTGEHALAVWPTNNSNSNILRYLVWQLCKLRIVHVSGEYRFGEMSNFRDFNRDRSGWGSHRLKFYEAIIVSKTITRKRAKAACEVRIRHTEQVEELVEFVISSSVQIVQFLEENEKKIGHVNVWPAWLSDAE